MEQKQQKIVFFGGPSTGKTTIIQELKNRGFYCMGEISRQVTREAQEKGIDQLFLTAPLLFSEMLLSGRENQFIKAEKSAEKIVFFDRGIPEVFGYMDYLKTEYPLVFIEKSRQYRYDKIFYFPIWQEIYESDNERYESIEEAQRIDKFLINAYTKLEYRISTVPFGSVEERADYILNSIKK